MSDIFNVHLKVIDTDNSTSEVNDMVFARGCFRHMDGKLVPITVPGQMVISSLMTGGLERNLKMYGQLRMMN